MGGADGLAEVQIDAATSSERTNSACGPTRPREHEVVGRYRAATTANPSPQIVGRHGGEDLRSSAGGTSIHWVSARVAPDKRALGVGFVGVPRNYSTYGADLDRKACDILNGPSVGPGTLGNQAATLQFGLHAARVEILD